MKTDFISNKERTKKPYFDVELANPLDSAINNIQCAQVNKQNRKTEAYKVCVQAAIELLKQELH